MTEEQKKPYDAIRENDIMRYEHEMKQLDDFGYFINSDGHKSTDLDKKHRKRDFPENSVMPKRPVLAHLFYMKEHFESISKEIDSRKCPDVIKVAIKKWNGLTAK